MSFWNYFEERKQFTEEVGDYYLPIHGQPKQRAYGGRSKLKTRTWEKMVSDSIAEDAPEIVPAGRLGLRVLFLAQHTRGDLSNLIKSLEDAFNRRAYKDDAQIDYIEALRVKCDKEAVVVKVFERANA